LKWLYRLVRMDWRISQEGVCSMKRVWMYMGMALCGLFCAGGRVFADGSADVWSTATTAVTTASTNVVALLIAAIAIPVAFMGYKFVKMAVRRA